MHKSRGRVLRKLRENKTAKGKKIQEGKENNHCIKSCCFPRPGGGTNSTVE